jgi:hypothetical protein
MVKSRSPPMRSALREDVIKNTARNKRLDVTAPTRLTTARTGAHLAAGLGLVLALTFLPLKIRRSRGRFLAGPGW